MKLSAIGIKTNAKGLASTLADDVVEAAGEVTTKLVNKNTDDVISEASAKTAMGAPRQAKQTELVGGLCFVAGTKIKTITGDKNIEDIEPGDLVESNNGALYPVQSVETIYPDEKIAVYNFKVEDWHTYYVTETGILVHNSNCSASSAELSSSGGYKTSYGKSSGNLDKPKGWKVGDPIDNLTKAGNEPSWSTVQSRYWKNEAFYNSDLYSERNLQFMKKGKAPHYDLRFVPNRKSHL